MGENSLQGDNKKTIFKTVGWTAFHFIFFEWHIISIFNCFNAYVYSLFIYII